MIVRRRDLIPTGGLGFTYYDLLDQAGRENCDPKDFACVGRNQQRANAVEDLWGSTYMTHAETADLPVPKINIAVDTSQRATDAFLNNQPVEGSAYVQSGSSYQYVPPPAAVIPAPAPVVKAPVVAKPPSAVVNSSGGQNAPLTFDAAAVIDRANSATGLSLPWWAWAGGAAAALFFLKGGR